MSRLADVPMPAIVPTEWDIPRGVGIVAGVITLGALGYVIWSFTQPDDEEYEEEE